MPNESREKMVEALQNFNKSYLALTKAWDCISEKNKVAIENGYPFSKSFDELGISEWVETSVERLTKELVVPNLDMDKIKRLGELQQELMELGADSGSMIGVDADSGQWIINPFVDESCMYGVDPVDYYGEAFLKSDFCLFLKEEVEK